MDEAPLIVKKNCKNFELCASCNQPLKKPNYLNTDRNFYKSNNNLSNLSNTGGKNTFRNNSNHHINLNINMNQTNYNFNKKFPGINSYTQLKRCYNTNKNFGN